MSRNALGRGLEALIRESTPVTAVVQSPITAAALPTRAPSDSQLLVDIDLIEPSPYQPRTQFREEALAELAQSIQTTGIIQPLVLRRIGARFQLLAGERRWRAAQRAGLTRVPAVVREVSDETALEITLVENIQREDLNPIEEARAYDRLMTEFHLTQEEVAARTGKDRATVANAIRLLRLEKPILDFIQDGRISAGHGRALLAVADTNLRIALSRKAARGGLTVRQLERFASRRSRPAAQAPAPAEMDPNTRAALEQLQQDLGLRVTLRMATKTKPGELAIEYYDDRQLANLYERLIG
jgi:ParB family chromosome partitioning protein